MTTTVGLVVYKPTGEVLQRHDVTFLPGGETKLIFKRVPLLAEGSYVADVRIIGHGLPKEIEQQQQALEVPASEAPRAKSDWMSTNYSRAGVGLLTLLLVFLLLVTRLFRRTRKKKQ